ncbi:hypothetical protein NPIL_421711 [Nephila pilipes]|uniref:Uncharacterized protein n=1 Tax=Nephila pilipes TaxID=299642 RepID=A0A8X6NVG1_NEPPI|nr:hypothetical protein NPIL_421711 [Nephila pilipes]
MEILSFKVFKSRSTKRSAPVTTTPSNRLLQNFGIPFIVMVNALFSSLSGYDCVPAFSAVGRTSRSLSIAEPASLINELLF